MSDSERLRSILSALRIRDKVSRAIRSFFHERDFIEVETPVRVRTPAIEEHIDAEPSGDCFLRTSPELHMKRMLSAGYRRIFQMGPCFRQNERGYLHNPEYTMLEWYRADADYSDILLDTKTLILAVADEVLGTREIKYQGQEIDLSIWDRIPVRDAFIEHAGWDPTTSYDAMRFDVDLVDKVEPNLARNVPVVLTDYPKEAAALARIKADDPTVAERWELYIGGLELANAYSELTDPAEQRQRFEECSGKREAAGRAAYPLDEDFLDALKAGMPPSGGIALGVDRLVMLMADAPTLQDVMAFVE